MENITKTLKERFSKLYKNCEPLAFQLDGFTHNVYFLDYEDLKVKKEETSGYMSGSEKALYKEMTDRCSMLFLNIPHYCYQNNAKEIIIHEPGEIEILKQTKISQQQLMKEVEEWEKKIETFNYSQGDLQYYPAYFEKQAKKLGLTEELKARGIF